MRRHALTFVLIAGWSPFAGAQPPSCAALPAVSLERAACHARLRQWKEAEEVYRAYARAHPESVPAALGHVEVLLRMAQEQVEYAVEASQELRKLVEAHPDDPAVLRAQASLLGNVEKNPRAAEEVLAKITQIASRDGDAWSLLGSFYLDSQRIEEGIRCFERAAALDSANPLYRAGLARGYAAAGRDAEAEKAFATAVETARPDSNPAVFVWYGDFLASAGRYDESGRAYARAVAANPADGEAWLKRAGVEVKAGRYREAEADTLAALERGAGEREVQTQLVRVYRGLGDGAKAQAAAAAVERAANAEEERRAKWRRARTTLDEADRLMQANRISEALPLYVRVTAEMPAYADAWLAAGVCYSQAGDAKRAEESFRTFLRLQPLSAEGHSALGLLLLSQQRIAEARAELQEALRLDAAAAEAREALQMLDARAK
jgi:protein O-GlcNAc transferase